MNSKTLIIVVVLLVVLVGGYLFLIPKKTIQKMETQTNQMQAKEEEVEQIPDTSVTDVTLEPETSNPAMKSYTLSEIASHSKPTDCWFAISGKVYDVTKYIAGGLHPGEDKILLGCGKDATTLFETKAGKGQDHSEKAYGYLANWQIGTLSQ